MKLAGRLGGLFAVGLALMAFLAAGGCASTGPADVPTDWTDWQAKRRESIAGTNGWATVVGLQWLHEGTNAVEIPTTAGPKSAGFMIRSGGTVRYEVSPELGILHRGQVWSRGELRSDQEGLAEPDVLQWGTVRFFVIARGERLGVRFKDSQAEARRSFHGLTWFPYDPAWRIEGRFVPAAEPVWLTIADVTGASKQERSPGRFRFAVSGIEYVLETLWDEETQDYFVLFRDATAGQTTYGSGRFLHVAREDATGRVWIDFNFAYNPPCAFTPFATCPIPPRRNWLPFPVTAGERSYRGH